MEKETIPNLFLPLDRLIEFAHRRTHIRDLDPLTSQALTNFAVINYRIRNIAADFRETIITHRGYIVHGSNEGEKEMHLVSREEYPSLIRNLSSIAFNLYNTYLSSDENTREAANEIVIFINRIFPKNK